MYIIEILNSESPKVITCQPEQMICKIVCLIYCLKFFHTQSQNSKQTANYKSKLELMVSMTEKLGRRDFRAKGIRKIAGRKRPALVDPVHIVRRDHTPLKGVYFTLYSPRSGPRTIWDFSRHFLKSI